MAAQQGIDPILKIAGGQWIRRRPVGLSDRSFKLFDLSPLGSCQITTAELVARIADTDQVIAKLTSRALGGGCWIIELMRQSRRQFSKGCEAVALLFEARCLPNPVRHQSDKTRRQLRHLLNEFWKPCAGKAQNAAFGYRA